MTHDGEPHQLLDHPSDTPWRTGVGAAVLAFAIVLTLAGSDDVQAKIVGVAVETLANAYRIMLLVLPVVIGLLTFELARELRDRRNELPAADARIVISRTDSGGFVEQPEKNTRQRQ